ncbi:TPA: replication protein, partial [Clostridioides difficile]|nr:replication protein [Clostridioides difficile]HBG7159589.1 replication protein [Clostridioides difficile]HBH1455749.1 replication protein [Clostridioides difficile]HBH1456297.1 replication protein [Clostridioides difficile]HBH2634709.1 replication protein [Clostridioides difficile]
MGIIRVSKDKDNPYVVLNKTCLEDVKLSWQAKG